MHQRDVHTAAVLTLQPAAQGHIAETSAATIRTQIAAHRCICALLGLPLTLLSFIR